MAQKKKKAERFEIEVTYPIGLEYPNIILREKSMRGSKKVPDDPIIIPADTNPSLLAAQIGHAVLDSSETLMDWIDFLEEDEIECTYCWTTNFIDEHLCGLCGRDLLDAVAFAVSFEIAEEFMEKYPRHWGTTSKMTDRARDTVILEKESDLLWAEAKQLAQGAAWICPRCVAFNEPENENCMECGITPEANVRDRTNEAHDLICAHLYFHLMGFYQLQPPFNMDLEARLARKLMKKEHSDLYLDTANDAIVELDFYNDPILQREFERLVARYEEAACLVGKPCEKPRCNTTNPPDAEVCFRCGTKLPVAVTDDDESFLSIGPSYRGMLLKAFMQDGYDPTEEMFGSMADAFLNSPEGEEFIKQVGKAKAGKRK